MSVMLTEKRHKNEGGYFRIGHVILSIPPESIETSREIDNREITALRGRNVMFQKTGHSKFEATIRWKALVLPSVTNSSGYDYSQWEDLRNILAIFKAAPFVEVENGHLRQMLADSNIVASDARLAFALQQLHIDTVPDSPQTLEATLVMTLFNFLPYSFDFGYRGTKGQTVSADDSDLFKDYIQTWMKTNLVPPTISSAGKANDKDVAALNAKFGYPAMDLWDKQEPGITKFHWRKYDAVPVTSVQIQNNPTVAPTPATKPAALARPFIPIAPASGDYVSRLYYIIAIAIQKVEGWTVGKEVNGVRAGGSPAWRNHNPGNLRIPGSVMRGTKYGNFTYFDSDQIGFNALLKDIAGKFHKYPNYTFLQFFERYAPAKDNNDPGKYSRTVIAAVNKGLGTSFTIAHTLMQIKGKDQNKPASSFSAAETGSLETSLSSTQGVPVYGPPTVLASLQGAVDDLLTADWEVDHGTDRARFFFHREQIQLDPSVDELGNVYPLQLSIRFVNNLAQQTRHSHPYPTYQHIGPAAAKIVIGILSNGLQLLDSDEPEHPVLNELVAMTTSLDSQFERLRGEWRAVSSVHRMQSVIVENQVLNMLGIFGTLPAGIHTETIEESPTLVQAALTLMQYENVYEEIEPFRAKGFGNTYKDEWTKVLDDPNSLSDYKQMGDTGLYQPLIDFQKARASGDETYLFSKLRHNLDKIALVPMPVKLSTEEETRLRQGETDDTIKKHSALTFNDYFYITRNPLYRDIVKPDPNSVFALKRNAGGLSTIQSKVDKTIAGYNLPVAKSPVRLLYDAVLDHLLRNDPAFGAAVAHAERIGPVSKTLSSVLLSQGPGASNPSHGSYRDLGLNALTLNGFDFNPAMYFINYSAETEKLLRSSATLLANKAVALSDSFNRQKSDTTHGKNNDNSNLSIISSDPNFAAGHAEEIIKTTSFVSHSMARAFPTFKLFLIEEDNTRPYVMFDNFYSYGSVLSIEIIRYQSKPDTAVVQITNFANILSHKLFDGTAAGKQELKLSNLDLAPTVSTGEAVINLVGGVDTAIVGGKDINGHTYGLDLSSGFGSANKPVPLQYYALQPGSKIQIRMGYSNDPDELWPVFTGKVTQVEGSDILTLVAQSYLLELMDPAPEDLKHDGYLNLGVISNVVQGLGQSVLDTATLAGSGGIGKAFGDFGSIFGKGPAYGGFTVFGDSGEVDTVIESVLKTSGAKHFGMWQVGSSISKSVQGFKWTQLAAAAAGAVGLSTLSSVLGTAHDRRGENILVNHLVKVDGSVDKARLTRSWSYEQPFNLLPAAYHVPKDPQITPWKIIADVARRYPDYILSVKQYGFPYGADATLIFAHPNDLWTTRRELLTPVEQGRYSEKDEEAFKAWWSSIGLYKMRQLLDNNVLSSGSGVDSLATGVASLINLVTPFVLSVAPGTTFAEDTSFWKDSTKVTNSVTAGGLKQFNAVFDYYNGLLQSQEGFSIAYRALGLASQRRAIKRIEVQLQSIQKSLEAHLNQAQAQAAGKGFIARPGDRVQPVRRWHYVTEDLIIKNEIKLNREIFNSVRVDDNIYKANESIESFYQRILDCDKLIIEPTLNARSAGLGPAYAQSFLREEIGKMYEGELILSGIPEIEPFDILLINDPGTGMLGPVEVGTVIHSFDQDMGYITIVKPRALVLINEALTAGIVDALVSFGKNLGGEIQGATEDISNGLHDGIVKPTALLGSSAIFSGLAYGVAGLLSGAALSGVVVTASTVGIFFFASERQGSFPVFVAPLGKFGRPWVAGLEGYQLEDLHSSYTTKLERLWDFEITPTIESFKTALNIIDTL